MEFRHKGRFRIIDVETGERLETIFCEEGKDTVDVRTLGKLLPRLADKFFTITRVVWDDYDEINLYVRTEEKPEGPKENTGRRKQKSRRTKGINKKARRKERRRQKRREA